MTVLRCSGYGCERLISVSAVPGGNPAANRDPEGFATIFLTCQDCGSHYCDRCVKRARTRFRGPRCRCGGKLKRPDIAGLLDVSAPGYRPDRQSSAVADPNQRRPDPPLARTDTEASFYTALHPCGCGHGPTTFSRAVIQLEDDPGIEYSGACSSCGRYRRFVFRGPAADEMRRPGVFSFGTGTSDLLDAGEWLWVAEMAVSGAPVIDQGEAMVTAIAIAAVEEVLKFIPPGQDVVPANAFWSERSRLMWVAEPGQFRRDRLLILRDTYRGRPAEADQSSTPPASRRSASARTPASWQRSGPLRLQVPGRCPSGSFSPDGSELAVASGFQRINNQPVGEVCVFAVDAGECVLRHEFEAYEVRVLHTSDGVLVADWQIRDKWLEPGCLARYTPGRREMLLPDVGINSFAHTPIGFAALTYQGDLLVGAVGDIRTLPPPGPKVCLAADSHSGRLAVGGDRLVLLDDAGRQLAAAPVPTDVHHVVFLDPDRLVTADPATVTLWRRDGDSLTVQTNTNRMPRLSRLVALRERGIVIGVDGHPTVMAAEVGTDSLRVVAPPRALHGRDVWAAPSGALVALPDRINAWLPPAPEQVEVHDTRAW